MNFLDKLERRFGFLAVQNIAAYIVAGQVGVWLLAAFTVGPDGASQLSKVITFDRELILSGELWRLFAFPLVPPPFHPLFLIFAWYIFYMMTSALEAQWGSFRTNVYLLIGAVFTIAAGLILPRTIVSNWVWWQTVVLAFAYSFPNFELMLFFVLPIKVRWIGWLVWISIGLQFLMSGWQMQIFLIASVSNYFLFFGHDIMATLQSKKRRAVIKAEKERFEAEAFHTCSVCSATDKSHPDRDFRYREDVCICEACLSEEKSSSEASG